MSEYVNGVRSKLIAAGSIEGCNQGVRKNLDIKDCVIANSLFLDWLVDNGLRVRNGATLDIVTISFAYGTKSHEEDRKHIETMIRSCDPADTDRLSRLKDVASDIEANKDKYKKITKEDLRIKYYTEGVPITWRFYNKDGTLRREETIRYRMLVRTAGKAKAGKCTFIREDLYDKALDFIRMGIVLPHENAPIVEIGVYSSLITSSIVGRIEIPPEDILILDDVDVPFRRNVVSIETNERNECVAVHRDDYELKSTLFDGQAIISSNIFPSWADGYVLLRHHFTKCAAFCGHIQNYFKDYCDEHGIDYETFQLKDRWGNLHLAKDIKLITTTNATKWIKFNVSYEYWCKKVHENGCLFGIVKTAHQSKLGDVQQMSYQMINTLGIDSMHAVMEKTATYVHQLQTDDQVFLQYLERSKNFSNDHEVLIALVKHNSDFVKSEYFKERRAKIIQGYITNMKTGKLIQDADNLVIAGNLYGMLMHSVGLDPTNDPTFTQEENAVQCYTERFGDGEYLADFRSPHNSSNNIGYCHNVYHEYFKKYFTLGQQIIVVNLNGTDFQDRHNGLTYWASVQKCA